MSKKLKTDGDLIKVLKRIDSYLAKVNELRTLLEESEHPNKNEIMSELDDNGIFPIASAQACIFDHLVEPDKWKTTACTINRI